MTARKKGKSNKISPTTSRICMFLSGIFMGNVGLLVTFLGDYNIFSIVFFRGLFGFIFLTFFMLWKYSFSLPFLKETFKNHWKMLILIAIVNPLVILFYFINITLTGYSFAAFLLYTGGIFFVFFLIISKEEKITKINLISFILAIIGVGIIMEIWHGISNIWGFIYGILSGILLGCLNFFKKKIYNKRRDIPIKSQNKGDFNIFLAWFATLFIVVMFFPVGFFDLFKLTALDLILCLILGLIPTALAFIFFNIGVINDKGGNIVILSYFEPVMATINTIIFLKMFSMFDILGGALILLANILTLLYSRRNEKK
ncbi:MAG: DMT family transporter [Promethearchaeia archaeon]